MHSRSVFSWSVGQLSVYESGGGEFQCDANVGRWWAVGGKGYVEGGRGLSEFQVLILAE